MLHIKKELIHRHFDSSALSFHESIKTSNLSLNCFCISLFVLISHLIDKEFEYWAYCIRQQMIFKNWAERRRGEVTPPILASLSLSPTLYTELINVRSSQRQSTSFRAKQTETMGETEKKRKFRLSFAVLSHLNAPFTDAGF